MLNFFNLNAKAVLFLGSVIFENQEITFGLAGIDTVSF